ncbi:hypothetical protein OH77DRAFT_719454 [Trametes cingulata]|nr:hypothetical protein OH77DRAFT_719454 [Trametes cingulata]
MAANIHNIALRDYLQMDPETVLVQVKSLRFLTAANATAAANRGDHDDAVKNVFVDRDFVRDEVTALENLVIDSVALHAQLGDEFEFAVLDPLFVREQANSIQAAIEDMQMLQRPGPVNEELKTMSGPFAVNLAENLTSIMTNNLALAEEREVDLQTFNISKVEFSVCLVNCLRRAVASHWARNIQYASCMTKRSEAEEAFACATQELAATKEAQKAAESKVQELEAQVNALRKENGEMKDAALRHQLERKHALNLAEEREKEVMDLRAIHMTCGLKVARLRAPL